MATLDLFPARVQFTDANGRLTPEAYRAINALFMRVGGSIGDIGDDVSSVFAPFISPEDHISSDICAPITDEPIHYHDIVQPDNKSGAVQSITVGSSPFSLSAQSDGVVTVQGGTVSAISITRMGVSVPLGITAGPVPVSAFDTVTVTYTVAPTIKFIPR